MSGFGGGSQIGAGGELTASQEALVAVLDSLSTTDSNFIVGNGPTWVSETGSTARASMGVTIGTNVQAWSSILDDLAAGGGGDDDVTGADVTLQNISPAAFTTLQDLVTTGHSNGVISGGEITDGGSGTVDIAAGEIMIRSTNSSVGEIFFADFPAVTGQAINDNALNIIHVQYNSGNPAVRVGPQALGDPNSNVILGSVYRDGNTTHISNITVPTSQAIQKLSLRLGQVQGLTRASGAIISETGTRNFALTAGVFWVAINQLATAAFDSSVAGTFSYWYDDNAGSFTEVTTQTDIDNLQFDDGSGSLATLDNNRYGVHWVYLNSDGEVDVVYGLASYTLTDATDATTLTNVPGHLTGLHSALVGKIIILKSASSFTTIQSPFISTFAPGIASDHADLSGLAWTSSGHTATLSTIAGFNGSGAAAEYTLSGTGTELSLTASPTFTGTVGVAAITATGAIQGTVLTATAASSLILGTASTATGGITFNNVTNSNNVIINSGITSTSYTLILPLAVGGAGEVLTDAAGDGILSWAAGASGATTTLNNLGSVAINVSLISDTDITDDLGTGDIRWNDAWIQTISSGLTATDFLKLRGRDIDGSTYIDILTITSANTVTADLNALVTIGGNAILDTASTVSALTTVGTLDTGNATAIVDAASDTVAGIIEIATGDETNTGTDATLAVSPDGLDDWTGSAQITTLGTLTTLTVDDITLNGKVITIIGSASDDVTFTAGTNGTLVIQTVDAAGAAANLTFTVDGTIDIDSAGLLTLDSGAAITLEPTTLLTFSANATPASVGGATGTANPGAVTSTGGLGGDTSIATTGTGGIGGGYVFLAGAGGVAASATTASTGGAGGAFSITTGAGGVGTLVSSNPETGGAGGAIDLLTGVGGAVTTGTGTNIGGTSGALTLITGTGGAAQDGTDTGGVSGSISITTGVGGAGDTGGASGSISLTIGAVGSGGSPVAGTINLLGNTVLGTDGTIVSLALTENASISYDEALGGDTDYSGVTIAGTGGATIVFGDLIFLDASAGEWLLTDADAVVTSGDVILGMAVTTSTDGNPVTVLLNGTIRSAKFPASIALGDTMYVSLTPGEITVTAPSATDDIVRVVAHAITTEPNTFYFNPSQDHITIV